MHYYQWNVADYRADTAHLSIIEHGIYRQLLDWYYLDERQIPLETQVVMRRLGLGSDGLHYLENVLADFFKKTDLGYYHERVESEIRHYHNKSARNRVNGKLGGRPKETQVVSEPEPKITQVGPKPITNNHKPITTNNTARGENDDLRTVGTKNGTMAAALIKLGVRVASHNPYLQAWVAEGFTVDKAIEAVSIARQSKPAPEPIAAKYIDTILRSKPKPRKEFKPQWWTTEQGTLDKMAELKMSARGGEGWADLRARINLKIEETKNG